MFESEELEYHKGRLYGLYRGYVYDNKDPENLGRLRLVIPSALGEDEDGEPIVSNWAYPMYPIAGNGWGIQYIPKIYNKDGSNVMVWVIFEMGDEDYPVWVGSPISEGSLQKDVQKNHSKVVNGKSNDICMTFVTPSGKSIIMDDNEENLRILATDKNGANKKEIIMDCKNNNIRISNGNSKIILHNDGVVINTPNGTHNF